ncbi:MAG TPA: N-acetylneuraminate synthase family protein [Xanthobacteraceae bacterium]|nr:N-acetylneuraminate synthase family protein [Xanthobacteraceae bacterium]
MTMPHVTLGNRKIAAGSRPYVIAEIGVNHGGDLGLAQRLIDLAKEGGADAAKFQTYKAERIASRHSPAYWDRSKEPTDSQFTLFKKYDRFGAEEFSALAEHCRRIGIDFVSTPFDAAAIDFLDPLVPFHKVASADLNNVPLLRQVAGKHKPVVMSTGASTLAEIDMAAHTLAHAGCADLVLMHCVLNYPCPNGNAHLNMIEGLQRAFPTHVIGYSDHTLPDERMLILAAAWLKGALVLEKHFTHDKTLPGNDHYHAMDVHDLKKFIANLDLLGDVMGQTHKMPLPDEAPAREHARRSIVLERPLKAGHVIVEADITYKRPAHGVSPEFWDAVIGRKLARDLDEDHVLQWSDLA